jgi:hypothetical protein
LKKAYDAVRSLGPQPYLLWPIFLGGALGLVTSLANADKSLPIARLDSIRGVQSFGAGISDLGRRESRWRRWRPDLGGFVARGRCDA